MKVVDFVNVRAFVRGPLEKEGRVYYDIKKFNKGLGYHSRSRLWVKNGHPPAGSDIAEGIVAFNDEKHQALSGKGCAFECLAAKPGISAYVIYDVRVYDMRRAA